MCRGEVHDLHGASRDAEHDLVEAVVERAQALDRPGRNRSDGAGLDGEAVSFIEPAEVVSLPRVEPPERELGGARQRHRVLARADDNPIALDDEPKWIVRQDRRLEDGGDEGHATPPSDSARLALCHGTERRGRRRRARSQRSANEGSRASTGQP